MAANLQFEGGIRQNPKPAGLPSLAGNEDEEGTCQGSEKSREVADNISKETSVDLAKLQNGGRRWYSPPTFENAMFVKEREDVLVERHLTTWRIRRPAKPRQNQKTGFPRRTAHSPGSEMAIRSRKA